MVLEVFFTLCWCLNATLRHLYASKCSSDYPTVMKASNNSVHITQRLVKCVEVWNKAEFELLFQVLCFHFPHNYICYFSCVPLSVTLWMSWMPSTRNCPLRERRYPHLYESMHLVPLYDGKPKTFFFLTCSDNESYKIVHLKHTEPLDGFLSNLNECGRETLPQCFPSYSD